MDIDSQKQERTKEAQNIRDTIKKELSYLRNKYPDRQEYVPKYALPVWVTDHAIGKWIETSNIVSVDRNKLKEQICYGALKTFCILVEIEREDVIQYFIQRSGPCGPDNTIDEMTRDHLKDFLNQGNQKVVGLWDKEKCEEFCSAARKYVAIEFTPRHDHRILPENAVLPFRKCEPINGKGNSQLSVVEFDAQYLHSAKTESDDSNVIQMMRKEVDLKSGGEREVIRYIRSRRTQPHPHIVELHASYTQNKSVYLLMPMLAGDLQDLLSKDELTSHFQKDTRYLREMLNLSEAITSLHNIKECPLYNTTGVHNDLKPANILLDSDGHFVLSDFGMSNLWSPTDGQEKESYGNEGWYLAPETRPQGRWSGKVGPKSDVFSLGCIFMELLVHMRGGQQAVAAFKKSRKPDQTRYYAPFHHQGEIISAVSAELESVLRDTNCVARAQIAGVVQDMLRVDPKERLSSKEVVARLKKSLGEPNPAPIPTRNESCPQCNRPSKLPSISKTQPSGDQRAEIGPSQFSVSEQASALSLPTRSQVGDDSGVETRLHRCLSPVVTEPRTETLTVAEVLAELVDKCEFENDSHHFLRVTDNITIKQQGQVMFIWKRKRWIQRWASSAASCVLFLHGDRKNDCKTLSYIAARVIKSAADVREPCTPILLRHFGNENRKNGDIAVRTMMQSLLRQLLSQQDRMGPLDLPSSSSFSGTDIESLRNVFELAIKALPVSSTVVCVIDGLHSYYDAKLRAGRAREMERTLPSLISMVSLSQTTHCRFKLLLTASPESDQSLAVRICRACDIKADNPRLIGRDALNMDGLRDSFWADNQLTWV